MEVNFNHLITHLNEFISGEEKDLNQLRRLAQEVVTTYQNIPVLERYQTIQTLLLNTAGLTGEKFFHYLSEEIRNVLSAHSILIAFLDEDQANILNSIVFNNKGKIIENFSYHILDSPCEMVIKEKREVFYQHVQLHFPNWSSKIETKELHYYGMPLVNANDQAIGLFVALFDQIPHHLDWAKLILELMSGRIVLELQELISKKHHIYQEKKLEQLLKTITDYIVINKVKDNQVVETWHSSTCFNVTGYTSQEFMQDPYLWYNMIFEPDKRFVSEQLQKIIQGADSKPFEHRIIHKNGSVRWIRNTPVIFRDSNGKINEFNCIVNDISEIKLLELQMLEEQQQYQLLFNTMMNGCAICEIIENSDLKLIDINVSFENLFEKKKENVIGRPISEVYPNWSENLFKKFINLANRTESDRFVDFIPSLKRYIEIFCYSPKANLLVLMFNDITDRINSTNMLKESESRYKSLVESSPDAIFVIQKNKIVYCNQQGQILTAARHIKELEVIDFNTLFEVKITDASWENELFEEGKLYVNQLETELIQINGKKLFVEVTICGIFFNQKPALQVIVRDISEKKLTKEALWESEQRFMRAMDAVNDGVFEWDILQNKLFFSAKNFTLLGYEPDEFEPTHYIWDSFIHPDDRAQNYVQLRRHLKGETPFYELEYRIRNKNGEYQWILERGKVIERTERGEPAKIIGIHSNINERKKLEENLRLAKEKAEESDRLKSAFLANMSHEIRTPMNGIIGFADLLGKENLTVEKRDKYIKVIKNSAAQLLQIINDVLDISKIEAGLMTITPAMFNVNALMDELKLIFEQQLTEKNKSIMLVKLKCKKELDDDKANIYSDRFRIQQVLSNLLSNAIKFTEKGSIEFGYSLQNNQILFYVKDTGIGIDSEHQQVIFERFRQVDIETSRKYGGTGLGLSIAKGLVELLGGSIWLESELGKGSTFYFSIPYSNNL